MSDLMTGMGYFFKGLKIITRPGLRGFVIIPLVANVAVFLVIAGSLYQLMSGIYVDFTGELTSTWSFLTWIVAPLICIKSEWRYFHLRCLRSN